MLLVADVWAVGSHYDGVDDRPLAEHFDGIQWVMVNAPTPGRRGAYLRGVGGASGTDVRARKPRPGKRKIGVKLHRQLKKTYSLPCEIAGVERGEESS